MADIVYPARLSKNGQFTWVETPAAYQQKLWEGWRPADDGLTVVPPGPTYVTRPELDELLRNLAIGEINMDEFVTEVELQQFIGAFTFRDAVRAVVQAAAQAGSGITVTPFPDGNFSLNVTAVGEGGTPIEGVSAVPGLEQALAGKADDDHTHSITSLDGWGQPGLDLATAKTQDLARLAIDAAPASLADIVEELIGRVEAVEAGGGTTPPPSGSPVGFGNNFGNSFGGTAA